MDNFCIEIRERKEEEERREAEFQLYLVEGSDSSLDDFDIPGRPKKKKANRELSRGRDLFTKVKEKRSVSADAAGNSAIGGAARTRPHSSGPSCSNARKSLFDGKKNADKEKPWKGKGMGKSSKRAAEQEKLRAERLSVFAQSADNAIVKTGDDYWKEKGKGQGKSSSKAAERERLREQEVIAMSDMTLDDQPSSQNLKWKGKGKGKKSVATADQASIETQPMTTVENPNMQDEISTIDGRKRKLSESSQTSASQESKKSKDEIFTQVDGTNDAPSVSSSESLPSTVVMSDVSEDLLANGHEHNGSIASDGSSNAQAADYLFDQRALDDQIYRCVPIAPGWPTVAEATDTIPREHTEPLMRPDFDDPGARRSDGDYGSTSEYSVSTIDGDEEVNRNIISNCFANVAQINVNFLISLTTAQPI